MRKRSCAIALLVISGCIGGPTTADQGDEGDPPDVDTDTDATAGKLLSMPDKTDTGETEAVYAQVCAQGATVPGIDVSYYQGTINWSSVYASGIRFAFIRVSDGTGFHDPKFASYWSAAKTVGLIRGTYQFFRPNQDVVAQADLLIDALGGHYTAGDLPPVIDVEATGGLSPASVASKVRQWVDRVKARLGVDPIVYTGKYFWRDQVGGPTSFAGNPLWIAHYTTHCPDIPAPWPRWTFWQHSDAGSVAGIAGHVDVDKFNGSLADLQAFANGSSSTDPPPPTKCASATLDRDVDAGTCVQAASDGKWYGCSAGMWIGRSSSAGCSAAFAWCSSATLHTTVPPRTCVQAASDHIWYQCDGSGWATPVSSGSGPAGTCSSMHSL